MVTPNAFGIASTLSHTGITSLDGFINDEQGHFDWSAPDAEVHQFVNDVERSVGTYLLGRRMFEVMRVWETMPPDPESAVIDDYASLWRSAEKVVFSATLAEVTEPRTRLERVFEADAVRAIPGEVSIGGATLAAAAIRAGLVDEFRMLVNPIIVVGGTPHLPAGVTVPAARRGVANGGYNGPRATVCDPSAAMGGRDGEDDGRRRWRLVARPALAASPRGRPMPVPR